MTDGGEHLGPSGPNQAHDDERTAAERLFLDSVWHATTTVYPDMPTLGTVPDTRVPTKPWRGTYELSGALPAGQFHDLGPHPIGYERRLLPAQQHYISFPDHVLQQLPDVSQGGRVTNLQIGASRADLEIDRGVTTTLQSVYVTWVVEGNVRGPLVFNVNAVGSDDGPTYSDGREIVPGQHEVSLEAGLITAYLSVAAKLASDAQAIAMEQSDGNT